MNALAKAMCKAGLHSGAWSHPGQQCEIVRVCDSCGKADEKSRHVWGDFAYRAAGQCEQTRRCQRCGSAQTQLTHDWGPWSYVNNELNSPQVHTCRRCHQSERTAFTMR